MHARARACTHTHTLALMKPYRALSSKGGTCFTTSQMDVLSVKVYGQRNELRAPRTTHAYEHTHAPAYNTIRWMLCQKLSAAVVVAKGSATFAVFSYQESHQVISYYDNDISEHCFLRRSLLDNCLTTKPRSGQATGFFLINIDMGPI